MNTDNYDKIFKAIGKAPTKTIVIDDTKFGMEMAKKYEKRRMKPCFTYCGVDFNEEYRPYQVSIKQ